MKAPVKPVLGMILKGYPRISETFISNEILLLEKLGYRIHLFSMRQPRETFSHENVKQIRAHVDYLPETLLAPLHRLLFYNVLLAWKKPLLYAGALKTALRRFMRTHRSATLKHLLQAGYLVQRLLPGTGVVHLHAHFAHSPTSVALFASRLSGLPYSFTAHAKDIYTSDARQLREKIALARFVVTCTEYNQRHLRQIARGAPTPVYRVYHGIDINLFSRNSRRILPASPYRLITVARFTPKKGLSTVLEAVRLLCERGHCVCHTLIGDGDDRREVIALIKELKLDKVTRWLGTRPHQDVLEEYRRADVFVLGCRVASDGDRDGIPNVFLESMAMGVPVVATAVSAIPELVRDGQTGLLVPPEQPAAMADAVMQLLTDVELRSRIIRQGRERVIREFDNKKLILDLAAVMGEALKPDQG